MRKFLFLFLVFVAGGASSALAAPDFFGVKMISEDYARDIAVRENNKVPDFTNDRPGTDKHVYAYGYSSSYLGRGRGISFVVYNHSENAIATKSLFQECVLITKDGKRHERSKVEMQWRKDKLPAGARATFNVFFSGLDLRKEDVRMIVLSFGSGETQIFLYPLETKSNQDEAKAISLKNQAPVKKKDSKKKKDSQAPPSYPFIPDQPSAKEYGEAETHRIVYKDRPWTMGNPDKVWQHQEVYKVTPNVTPRAKAEVVIVNPVYHFVVIDAGFVDGINLGSEINVFRDGRRIGRVRVRQVRDKTAAASILPEWKTGEAIQVGDLIELEQEIG